MITRGAVRGANSRRVVRLELFVAVNSVLALQVEAGDDA
jgi:hypothetical protein